MGDKPRSFRFTSFQPTDNSKRKWWQFTKMDRRELGYTAIVGLLAGVILSDNVDLLSRAFGVSGLILSYVLGDLLIVMGIASALLWLYKVIRRQ